MTDYHPINIPLKRIPLDRKARKPTNLKHLSNVILGCLLSTHLLSLIPLGHIHTAAILCVIIVFSISMSPLKLSKGWHGPRYELGKFL